MARMGRAFAWYSSYGDSSLAPPSNVSGPLRDAYNGAVNWMNQTAQQVGDNQIASYSIASLQYAANALNFDSGTGAQMLAGSYAWTAYRDQVMGFMDSIYDIRVQAGIATDSSDPFYQWKVATDGQLGSLTVSNILGQAGQAAKEVITAGVQPAASAAGSLIPAWLPWVAGAGVAAWLFSSAGRFMPSTSTAGYSGYRRSGRKHKR